MSENGGIIGTLGTLLVAMGGWVFWLIQANRKSDEARNAEVEKRAAERIAELRASFVERLAEKDAELTRERANTEAWMRVALQGEEATETGVLISSAALHALRQRGTP